MMSLLRLNETTDGALVVDNLVIFPMRIVEDGDVLFECSCVCLSDVSVGGSLRAQYDLRVMGNLSADNILIGGKLDCANDLRSSILETGKDCLVTGSVKVDTLNVRGTLICEELGCEVVEVKDQLIIRGTADITGDTTVEHSIVCLEGITADGAISAEHVIACDYADVDSVAVVLSELADTPNKCAEESCQVSDKSATFTSIADEELESIKDYSSPLATVLDDVAAFIERCQETFPKGSLENELDTLKSLGSFLPSFALLYNDCSVALHVLGQTDGAGWYQKMIALADAYLQLPVWMEDSEIGKQLRQGIEQQLRLYQKTFYSTRSRSAWIKVLHALNALRFDKRSNKELCDLIDGCLPLVYGRIGIKPSLVKMYLPEL